MVLKTLMDKMAEAHEAFAVRLVRRALHQRAQGKGNFELDQITPFTSFEQVLIALPQLGKVSASVLSDVKFFCDREEAICTEVVIKVEKKDDDEA